MERSTFIEGGQNGGRTLPVALPRGVSHPPDSYMNNMNMSKYTEERTALVMCELTHWPTRNWGRGHLIRYTCDRRHVLLSLLCDHVRLLSSSFSFLKYNLILVFTFENIFFSIFFSFSSEYLEIYTAF